VVLLLHASITVFLVAGRGVPLLPAIGLFLGELVVGVGAWLAARKLFADPRTAFFVSVAALGSFLWGRDFYVGGFTLGFAVLGLIRLERRISTAVLVALAVLFPLFPPLAKLLLAFVAGAGFDAALRKETSTRTVSWTAAGLLLAGLGLVAASILSPNPTVRELLDTAALWAAVASGSLFLLQSGPRAVPLAIALILFLHPLDLFGWKFRMTWQRPPRQEVSVR
jgi:hypothetical protein